MRRLSIGLAVILLSAGVVVSAVLQPLTLDELIEQADLIILGSVQDVRASDQPGAARSMVIISARQVWKAQKVEPFRVIQEGGVRNGIAESVPGFPTFRPGEDVLLFLVRVENDYHVLNGKQGKWTLQMNHQGETIVHEQGGRQHRLQDVLQHVNMVLQSHPKQTH